jgi:hypothetical protein
MRMKKFLSFALSFNAAVVIVTWLALASVSVAYEIYSYLL